MLFTESIHLIYNTYFLKNKTLKKVDHIYCKYQDKKVKKQLLRYVEI